MKTIRSDTQGNIDAERGVVFVDGPAGLTASMTPAAARRIGRGLIGAARTARQQDKAKRPAKTEPLG